MNVFHANGSHFIAYVSLGLSAIQFLCADENILRARIVANNRHVQLTNRYRAAHYVICVFELFPLVFIVCALLFVIPEPLAACWRLSMVNIYTNICIASSLFLQFYLCLF